MQLRGPTLSGSLDFLHFEKIYSQYSLIAGLDEAGRGAWAGPVCAAAVIMPKGLILNGVDDSKKLNVTKRESLYTQIISTAVAWGVGLIDVGEIDVTNILLASKRAMLVAIASMAARPDFLMIDGKGMELAIDLPQVSIIDGDALSHSIASASILAKVTRDRVMQGLGQNHPEYGFERHVGYGTKQHQEALARFGVLPLHRRSYKPIKKILAACG